MKYLINKEGTKLALFAENTTEEMILVFLKEIDGRFLTSDIRKIADLEPTNPLRKYENISKEYLVLADRNYYLEVPF